MLRAHLRNAHVCMVQVVDTTGAGDCFTGAVAVGMLEGKSYQEAMQFAGIACPSVNTVL